MHTLTTMLSKSNGNVPHNPGKLHNLEIALHILRIRKLCANLKIAQSLKFWIQACRWQLVGWETVYRYILLLPTCHNTIYNTELCHLSINSGRLLRGFVWSDSETVAAKPARQLHERRGWRLSIDCGTMPLQKCMAQIQSFSEAGFSLINYM